MTQYKHNIIIPVYEHEKDECYLSTPVMIAYTYCTWNDVRQNL